jgi:hypothetical protein
MKAHFFCSSTILHHIINIVPFGGGELVGIVHEFKNPQNVLCDKTMKFLVQKIKHEFTIFYKMLQNQKSVKWIYSANLFLHQLCIVTNIVKVASMYLKQ